MAFDITPYIDMKPSEVRKLIPEGVIGLSLIHISEPTRP